MTMQSVQFVPQGPHPTTQALKLSIALETLANTLYDMEAYFDECRLKREAPDFYSYESWENYVRGARFLNDNGKLISYSRVEEYLLTL